MSAPEHKQHIYELACRYAQAVDRRDFAGVAALFASEASIVGPGFRMDGIDAIVSGMSALNQYSATQHHIHQQFAEVDGNVATAETYCVANHLYTRDGVARKLDWGIRYQDKLCYQDGRWRFVERNLLVDWTQDLPVVG
ncbi:hypothetical protein PTE30175_00524 [Pandoraea terrae]|uniref:SnoaL-like domain-containing protein n=1 Tax=Pandoraea terrae TaxID=1537710 RepID=A0A5E4S5U7_9BURK|nr:nuclear transport factor 2 family protein [Pandoraea terrae]VVD70142.1 hypothetical protein PTE30175_00524 [Pandoraea terrae]